MLPAHGRLVGNSLFARCHVTMNQLMNARVVLRKTPVISQFNMHSFNNEFIDIDWFSQIDSQMKNTLSIVIDSVAQY